MFRAWPRGGRPILLLLVYGAVLITIGITATSQAGIVSSKYRSTALEAICDSDTAAVRGLVNRDLRPSDLTGSQPSAARTEEIEAALAILTVRGGIAHVEIRLPNGTVLAADQPGRGG